LRLRNPRSLSIHNLSANDLAGGMCGNEYPIASPVATDRKRETA
jgi:hypothetical protein